MATPGAFAMHAEFAVLETSIDQRFQGLEQRARESINASVATLKEQVDTLVTEGWTTANTEFTREQATVRVLVEEMKSALRRPAPMDGLLCCRWPQRSN